MEKCKPFYCAGGIQIVTATVHNIMEVPSNLKGEIPYDPPLLPLGVYAEKSRIRKDICTQSALQHHLHEPKHGGIKNVHGQVNRKRRTNICMH